MKKTFWVPIALALAAYLVLPLPGLSAPIPQRIEKKREQISEARHKEGVLSTTIQRFSTRIESLQGEISATQSRLERAQQSLDRQREELLEADGFGDLLERAEFLERISEQDRDITDRVRGLRDQARDPALELADLEEREQ